MTTLLEKCRQGETITGLEIIDMHGHLGRPAFAAGECSAASLVCVLTRADSVPFGRGFLRNQFVCPPRFAPVLERQYTYRDDAHQKSQRNTDAQSSNNRIALTPAQAFPNRTNRP